MVYVLNKNGKPIMPTNRHGKVKHLLRDGLAKVIHRCPFTIQLLYDTTEYKQDITLGVDAGSKHIGVSATTKDNELYAADVTLRNDIVDLLSSRRELRRGRRGRHTRYRPARFNNRVRSKHKGWLAPSIEQKIATHMQVVKKVTGILPITDIIIETASFDIQKLKNPDISGAEYQEGEQLGFWNVREYVLFRDGHTCQCCKGKSKDPVLNVHHLESRKTGGNSPSNLITLCETCHHAYHQGKVKLNIKRGASYRDSAFMGIMRWTFYERLKRLYPSVHMTFGYLTKNMRIRCGLEKDHAVDARCITGNPMAHPLDVCYMQRATRRHNRMLHRCTILKGGYRKNNQCDRYVFGYQLFDKVLFNGKEAFIGARRKTGSFGIRELDNTIITSGVTYKKLKLLEKRKTILTQRVKRNSNIENACDVIAA